MYKIMFCAGEASGDLHGASVAAELKRKNPAIKMFGVGGKAMKAAGVEIICDIDDLGVVGLVEVIKSLPRLAKLRKSLQVLMAKEQPDVLVVIDYYEFNKRLAVIAKELGIPVISYISPKVWASRSSRAREIAKSFDHMVSIHPWETEIYQQAGASVTFVGHPLLDIVKPSMTREEAYSYFGADSAKPIILLMPGSRKDEINNILPVILAATKQIAQKMQYCQFFLPIASTISREILQKMLTQYKVEVKLTDEKIYDLMSIADAAIVASGTATLETALMNLPTVLVYRLNPITYILAKHIVKIPYVGLPNIAAGRQIIPELIQKAANPERISQEVLRLLTDTVARQQMLDDFSIMRQKLGDGGAVERAAQIVLKAAQTRAGGKR